MSKRSTTTAPEKRGPRTAVRGFALDHAFYDRPAIELAPDLIGQILVRRADGREMRARIVETEAYVGTHDLACHASKGRTKRTEVMFGPAGHAYVYLIYGMYEMFNIVAGAIEDAQAVLIRAAEPLDGWDVNLSGPGKLARGLQITRAHNGLDLTGNQLFVVANAEKRPRIVKTERIGVDYAGAWSEALLRFCDRESVALSKPFGRRPLGRRDRVPSRRRRPRAAAKRG